MAARPASTSTLADYLTTGYWREQGISPHHFSSNTVTVDLGGLTIVGRALARQALDAWATVADLRFVERSSGADITFDDNQSGAETNVSMSGSRIVSADVNIGSSWLSTYGSSTGSYGYHTYLHEIGHALGLGHSAVYSGTATYRDARFTIDSWQTTVMSYLDQDENPTVDANKLYVVTPMMADIEAMQDLYGRPQGGETAGRTTWRNRDAGGDLHRNAMTIYDESGTDTIDFGNDSHMQKVKLNGGSYSDVYGNRGNLGIAQGTEIENFVAGSNNDNVTGNRLANVLRLNDGRDVAFGQGGNDKISGDKGDDSLKGGKGADWLSGGDDDDRLDGGEGNDDLIGGGGADSFVFGRGHDCVSGFSFGEDRLVLDRDLWGGGSISVDKVLGFAQVAGSDIVFDFGGGDTLRMEGRTNIAALADDLAFA